MWVVLTQTHAHIPCMPPPPPTHIHTQVETPLYGEFSSTLGTIFYVWMFHLLLPVFVRNMVTEKHARYYRVGVGC